MNMRYQLIANLKQEAIKPFASLLDFDDAIAKRLPPKLELDGSEQEQDGLRVYVWADDKDKSTKAVLEALNGIVGAENVIGIDARAHRGGVTLEEAYRRLEAREAAEREEKDAQ